MRFLLCFSFLAVSTIPDLALARDLSPCVSGQAQCVPAEGFESFVTEQLEAMKVPGIAVGIVRHGQLIYARGFGYRDVDAKLPVTPETLFAIGSTTKAFTATVAGLALKDHGLRFNQPVIEYVPEFRLKSDTATLQATMIDLLTHRTGVPRHDLVWYGFDEFPREYFFKRLRYLEPSAGFREVWQYNNFMYMAAGYIVEQLTEQTWEDYVRERLLRPLGMNDTNFSVEASKQARDFARPYGRRGDAAPVEIPFRPIVGMGPAGSINSNVRDLAKWVQLNLGGGKWSGQQLVPADIMGALHAPQVAIPQKMMLPFPEFSFPSYALGWIRQHYRGHDWIWHNGGIDGFMAHVGFLPDDDIGIIVLQNATYADAMTRVALRAMDETLGLAPIDWGARMAELEKKEKETGEEKGQEPVAESTAPPQPLDDYVGRYVHPAYGDVNIVASAQELRGRFHNFEFQLQPLINGTFRLKSDALAEFGEAIAPAYFQIDSQGRIHELLINLEPTVDAIRFVKEAAP
ncbi:MAG: serine hydrolase [Bdellovibrionales bacterium]